MEQAWIQITCSFAPQYIRLLGIPNALSRWPIHSQSADWLFRLVNAYFSLSLSHSIRQLFAPKRHGRGQEGRGCFHSRPAGFSCSVTVFAACVVPSSMIFTNRTKRHLRRLKCTQKPHHGLSFRGSVMAFFCSDQGWHLEIFQAEPTLQTNILLIVKSPAQAVETTTSRSPASQQSSPASLSHFWKGDILAVCL